MSLEKGYRLNCNDNTRGEDMTKIKICGIGSIQDAEAVNKYLPEYVGFVFAESRRKISIKTARSLKGVLDSKINTVGVFVNEPISNIIKLCHEGIIDLIQLHGDEDEEYILSLSDAVSNKIIKTIMVQSKAQVAKQKLQSCDYLLLDTYVKGSYGGTGIVFNHKQIPDMGREYFLAGGINKDNVLEAISKLHPYCVDISSGVETDGRKDEKKIREFICKVRSNEAK